MIIIFYAKSSYRVIQSLSSAENEMASKIRTNQRGPLGVVQSRSRGQFSSAQVKKTVLKPIPPKQNIVNENDSETQPISDYPSPPVQIVSCRHGQPGEMLSLPSLSSAPIGEIPQLTVQKLKQCQRKCDFSDVNADAVSKATKKATLNELIDLYSNPKMFSRLTRECHQQLIEMFAANVFRPPPNIPRALLVSDEVTIEDTAWPHLQLVYILFLKFLDCNVEQRILQYQLQPKFISNLFAVLDFPDERERIQARAVIASIYTKVPPQRQLLMTLTLNLLMSVPEDLELNAASHLLELFYQFTANIPPPLPPQLIQAFERVLLPLHLPYRCQRYFSSLVRCILLMIRKDARLANHLLQFLICHWPLTLDHKSELFIDEITRMLDETNPQDLTGNIKPLLSCVCIAAESPCMTLADKALKFLLNNRIQNLIVADSDTLLKIVFPPVFRVACAHWQRNLQVNALNVMNTLMELSPTAFRRVAENFKASAMMEPARKAQKKNLWDQVAQVATANDSSIDIEVVNFELNAFFGMIKMPSQRSDSQSQLNMHGDQEQLSRSVPSNMVPQQNSKKHHHKSLSNSRLSSIKSSDPDEEDENIEEDFIEEEEESHERPLDTFDEDPSEGNQDTDLSIKEEDEKPLISGNAIGGSHLPELTNKEEKYSAGKSKNSGVAPLMEIEEENNSAIPPLEEIAEENEEEQNTLGKIEEEKNTGMPPLEEISEENETEQNALGAITEENETLDIIKEESDDNENTKEENEDTFGEEPFKPTTISEKPVEEDDTFE